MSNAHDRGAVSAITSGRGANIASAGQLPALAYASAIWNPICSFSGELHQHPYQFPINHSLQLTMNQIDQGPGDYRVQRPDGSWTQRVNKPLCRGMSAGGMAFSAMMALASPEPIYAFVALVFGFLSGALFTLSLKSIDW